MLFPQKINVVASARHTNPHNETVVVQNDTAVEFYVAVVGDNGQTELPEGATYTLVCLHLRKEPTEKLGTLQEDGNVMFKLTHMELSETGPVQAQVRVYHPEGGRLTSNPFTFHVAPDPTYGAEIKPEDQSIIEQVIGEGPAIIAEAKEETTKNITERARLTGAVGDALDSLDQDKADALLEMSQSKTAADESAQTALQAADNADQERDRLTQEVTEKITEVESARTDAEEATGEARSAAQLAIDEADAARLQKQEVADILGAGPVASVNGKTGVVDGLATQESMNQVTAQLAETAKQTSVDSALALKASKTEVAALDTKINSQASGSPKPYATLTAIQTAFPTGDTKTYLSVEDGKWYYWNNSAWVAGGVYQGTGIADEYQLEIMKKMHLNPITNKIKNGDFRKDTNGDGVADNWVKSSSANSPRIQNNTQYWMPATTTAISSMLTELYLPNTVNHKYYISFKHGNVGVVLYRGVTKIMAKNIVDLGVERFSSIFEPNNTFASGELDRLVFYPKTPEVETYIKEVMLIDLTESFGIGNEPTKEKMDEFIESTGYFNGVTTNFNATELTEKISTVETRQNDIATTLNAMEDDLNQTVVRLENLIVNGDISDDVAGWFGGVGSTTYTTVANVNNELEVTIVTLGANYCIASQGNLDFVDGNQYYVKFKSKSPRPYRVSVAQGGSLSLATIHSSLLDANKWSEHSALFKGRPVINSTDRRITIGILIPENYGFKVGDKFNLDDILLIDLTKVFGKGFEPSVEKMDELMKQYPDSWFNGKENTNSIINYLLNKDYPQGGQSDAGEIYDKQAQERISELTEELSIVNRNMNSMIEVRNGKESTSQTIPIKNVGKQKLVLHLHKRENDGYDVANDVYLPHAETDFTDVRVKTGSGEILPYHVTYKGNIDIIPDKRLGIDLQGAISTDSNKNMIASQSGRIARSIDNGVTWNEIPSLNFGKAVRVVLVNGDDTIFFSEPGILYRSEMPYTTYTKVLDFTEGYTGLSLTSDRIIEMPSGEMFVGAYQTERVIRIFKSTDKGITWRQVINWEDTYQHVHGLYVDLYATPITIYAGVDGGGGVLKSTDKGETWLDLRTDLGLTLPQSTDKGILYSNSRGHKYLGGETAIVGGYSIIKTVDDVNFYPVLGVGNSVLKLNEFKGRLIASGNASASSSKSHRNSAIYISEDDGENWVQAYTTQPLTTLGANDGYRYMSKDIYSSTDYEQMIMGAQSPTLSPLRIISDENSYYAEIIVDVPDDCTAITVESGYLIANETHLSNTFEVPNKKLISLDLNDGGNFIKENVSGKIIKGDFSYHDVGKHMSVHYPYIINSKDKKSIKLSSLSEGIGVDVSLSELDAFTISFWGRIGYGANFDVISSLKPEGYDFVRVVGGYQLHSTGGTLGVIFRYPVIPDAFAKYDIVFDVLNGKISTYENGFNVLTSTTDLTTLLTNIKNLSEIKLFKANEVNENDAIQHLNIYEGALSENDIYNSYHDYISDNQH